MDLASRLASPPRTIKSAGIGLAIPIASVKTLFVNVKTLVRWVLIALVSSGVLQRNNKKVWIDVNAVMYDNQKVWIVVNAKLSCYLIYAVLPIVDYSISLCL